MVIYEVPDLATMQLLDDKAAVSSAIHVGIGLVARRQPLLGALLMQMQIVFDATPAPVSISVETDIWLHVNTDYWFFIQTNQQLADLLLHEALHVAQNHIGRFTPSRLVNLATDLTVNQFGDLADSPIIQQTGVTMVNIHQILPGLPALAPKQSADYYLQVFAAHGQQGKTAGAGAEQQPNSQQTQSAHTGKLPDIATAHTAWQRSQDNADQVIQHAVRQAMAISQQQGRGVVSDAVLAAIAQGGKNFQLPTLRQGIATYTKQQVRRQTERTYMRYATPRSAGVIRRGKRVVVTKQIVIHVFVDTSGSIALASLADTLQSLQRFNELQRTPVQYQVHYFDTQVYDEIPTGSVKGRGGTTIQAVFDWLKAHEIGPQTEQLIITDGQGEDTITDYGYRATWLITHVEAFATQIPSTHHVIRLKEGK